MSDFTLAIESVEELLDYEVLESKFENGAEQRRLKYTSELMGWRCTSPALILSGMTSYRNFFKGKYGSLTSFTWTSHIDGTEYTVRFTRGSFRTIREGGYFKVSWDFERVI